MQPSASAQCSRVQTAVCGSRLSVQRDRSPLLGGACLTPRRQRRAQPASAVAFAAPLVVQLAPAAAWTLVGVMALRVFLGGQQSQQEEGDSRPECETCGGTGTVECWCSRWSDGDGGCSTCRGSGRMVCSSCRGGGTAVPIKARIYIDNSRTDNFRQGR